MIVINVITKQSLRGYFKSRSSHSKSSWRQVFPGNYLPWYWQSSPEKKKRIHQNTENK